MLERALDPRERHKLGAHYTPRAYVERLVMPTIIEPLRQDWANVTSAAFALSARGDNKDALKEVEKFHRQLCETRILDPACGSGNFLYVTLEHMKRLEGEVIDLAHELGQEQYFLELDRHTVDPHQFLGIELNARAAVIAELVLWIGYLQWHFKTRGNVMPAEPVLKNFKNIENRDAILTWTREEPVLDDQGKPKTRWDGHSFKTHPVTGRAVPDETAQELMVRYTGPKPAEWPDADFIIGNPPFQGGKDLRDVLGDGYTEALWKAHKDMPGSADLVMYWWNMAAVRTRAKKSRRFGLITTNSIHQTFNRRVVEQFLRDPKTPGGLAYAIPDHPWVDEAGSANVRIAMTVGVGHPVEGLLQTVVDPTLKPGEGGDRLLAPLNGTIGPNLRMGADLTSTIVLRSNESLGSRGVALHGSGFMVTKQEAKFLGLGSRQGLEEFILDYRNGRDLTSRPRDVMVIDLMGLRLEEVIERFPEVYQWVAERVRPEREQNREEFRRKYWWWFGRTNAVLREAIAGLDRFIVTVETAKHRVFMFLDGKTRPDNKLLAIAHGDAFTLAILSSSIHVTWALAVGARLEDRPVYVKTTCFDPFPFPDPPEELKSRIRELGERLDAHRKRQQEAHADLTMTGMYNVLEKLKAGAPLDARDKIIHEQGLVSVLLDIHRDLDEAVIQAYGWTQDLDDEEILTRLVALNHERAAEEARGQIRWLRPDYQIPKAGLNLSKASQSEMDVGQAAAKPGTAKTPWPKKLPDQVQSMRQLLAQTGAIDLKTALKSFKGAKKDRLEEVLQTLVAMGAARHLGNGRYAP